MSEPVKTIYRNRVETVTTKKKTIINTLNVHLNESESNQKKVIKMCLVLVLQQLKMLFLT